MSTSSRLLMWIGSCVLSTFVFAFALAPASYAIVFGAGDNEIFFNNFEQLYDSTGVAKPLGSAIAVGDHFFGIFNVQNIDNNGSTIFFSGPQNQLTGLFAQRVEAILPPVPSDPFAAGQTTFPHIVLGAPTITSFGGVSTVGLLGGTEMIALWEQSGVGTTVFESNGTIAQDLGIATDGTKILSWSYSPGADGIYATTPANGADDTGYWYTHAPGQLPNTGNVGSSFLGLNNILNVTGYTFGQLNDVNETEVGDLPPGGKLNDLVGTSEIEVNPAFLNAGSPWPFRSNDPVTLNVVVPEFASLATWLGIAVIGVGAAVKTKFSNA